MIAGVQANDQFLEISLDDLQVTYGDYAEVELKTVNDEAITLSLDENVFPVGMQLEQISTNRALLVGAPEFLQRFCFIVKGMKAGSSQELAQRVCMFASENDQLTHPTFKTARELPLATESEFTSTRIEMNDNFSNLDVEFINGELPEGLQAINENGALIISGSTEYVGSFEFTVLAAGEEFYSYKQYQLEVREVQSDDPNDGNYQCPIGYYYDDVVGYCVQNMGSQCGSGTYYDYETNSCRAYPQNPRRSCGYGMYYDHFLDRCVYNNANRCPYNYEYDHYSNRCVRLPYTCSIGQRYDWGLRTCVQRARFCGINSYYSYARGRCISYNRYCRVGYYYDGFSCRRTVRNCRGDRYYYPGFNSCLPRRTYRRCGPGSTYSYRYGTCQRRTISRTCSRGYRYSAGRGCIAHRPVHTRPPRRVRRPVRNRPVVVRPHRPGNGGVNRPNRPNRPGNGGVNRPNRPNRPTGPTTRPSRPNRPTGPTTRPSRPNRPTGPTTRPNRPNRPTGPTTRPNRPNRPTGPTTRPSRPNRPTGPTTRPNRPTTRPSTRPSRPSGGSSRPTTRPSRPNRGSGSSTRPSRPNRGSSSSRSNNGRRRRGNE